MTIHKCGFAVCQSPSKRGTHFSKSRIKLYVMATTVSIPFKAGNSFLPSHSKIA